MLKAFLFILSLLFLFSCQKEEEKPITLSTDTVPYDFREQFVGTYSGNRIYYQSGADDSVFSYVTVNVALYGAYPSSAIAIYGDIVSGPNNPTHPDFDLLYVDSNYTMYSSYINHNYNWPVGNFRGADSLVYSVSVTHYATEYAHYFLKKQ